MEKIDNLPANCTLEQAKAELRKHANTGAICPCCEGAVKIYKRPLTSAMAYGLVLLYRRDKELTGGKYIHVENYLKSIPNLPASVRGDIAKLRFWGFLTQKKGDKEDGNPNNGFYRITDAGKAFVENRSTAHSHINIYNNKVLGYSNKSVTIKFALKNKFNYNEMVKLTSAHT